MLLKFNAAWASARNKIAWCFWSIFNRSIVGSYHMVRKKYMPLYIAECQFNYNNRGSAVIFGLG
jgi:hypothetical protein